MDFINNGYGIKKDSTKITCWNCGKKFHYADDSPYKNNDTDSATDESRKSVIDNVTNGIRDAIVMLQEVVHDG